MEQAPRATPRTALDGVPLDDDHLSSKRASSKTVGANYEHCTRRGPYQHDMPHGGVISVRADAASGASSPPRMSDPEDCHGQEGAPAPPLPDLSMPTAHLDIIHKTVWKVCVQGSGCMRAGQRDRGQSPAGQLTGQYLGTGTHHLSESLASTHFAGTRDSPNTGTLVRAVPLRDENTITYSNDIRHFHAYRCKARLHPPPAHLQVARLFGFQVFNQATAAAPVAAAASGSPPLSPLQWTAATAFVAGDHLTALLRDGALRRCGRPPDRTAEMDVELGGLSVGTGT